MVFGIPFVRLQLRCKKVRSESPLRLPSLPLTWHAESNGRPPVWAIIKSRTCRQRRQVWVRHAGPRKLYNSGHPHRGGVLPRPLGSAPPAAPFLPAAEEMGGKNAAKNQWFLKFLSSDCSCGAKRFRNESPLRLPSLPLIWHAESNGHPSVWAIIKSRTCRRLRQVWVRPAGPRPRARNIPFENKSAGRCGRRVRAQRLPVRKKERPPKRSFFFGSELSSN